MDNIPVNRANVFNIALPAIDTDLLASVIAPMFSPSVLQIYVSVSVAGKLYVVRSNDGGTTTVSEYLNGGGVLTANAAYLFNIAWKDGESINLRYNATGGTLLKLQIDESWKA